VSARAVPLRFKIDENVPVEAAQLLVEAGYDCHTVHDERLVGATDEMVALACQAEARVLVTQDLDFADVRAYPPGTHPGIIVVRPRSPHRDGMLALLRRAIPLLRHEVLAGCLWVLDGDRLRIRAPRSSG
jgi:predicted nuclease of predicted toxin-antitoxin system